MWKSRLLAVAGGAASALFHLAVLGGSVGAIIVALLAQLPLLLVGLTLGTAAALWAGGAATVVIAVAAGGDATLEFVIKTVVPAVVVVWLALISRDGEDGKPEWYPPGRIVGWLSAGGMLFILFASFTGPPEALGAGAQERITESVRVAGLPATEAEIARLVEVLRLYYPGMVAAVSVVLVMLNGMFGQWMAVRLGRNIRPSPRYSTLDLPRWMEFAILVSAAMAFLPGKAGILGQNALILLAGPFFFVGLAAIHTISVGWPGRSVALAVMYILVFGLGWPAVMVAGLGVFEPFLGLRRRFGRPHRDQEEE